MDLDTSKISFTECKPMKTKEGTGSMGNSIGIRYEGKALLVEYPKMVTPFGVGTNTDMNNKNNVTGYNLVLSLDTEYENDPVYQKACELDEFFIDAIAQNAATWGLDDADRNDVAGKDERGKGGLWRRLLKWSMKKNETTNKKEYLEYPPRLELKLTAQIQGQPGSQSATFSTNFFDERGRPIKPVTNDNAGDVCPKFSEVQAIVSWNRLSQGSAYGVTFKPIAKQLRVYPREQLPNEWQGSGDGEDEDDIELGDSEGFGEVSQPTDVPVPEEDVGYTEDEPVAAAPAPARPVRRVIRARPAAP